MSSDQLSVRLSLRQTPQFVDIDLEEDEDSSDEEYCPDEQEEDDTADEVSDCCGQFYPLVESLVCHGLLSDCGGRYQRVCAFFTFYDGVNLNVSVCMSRLYQVMQTACPHLPECTSALRITLQKTSRLMKHFRYSALDKDSFHAYTSSYGTEMELEYFGYECCDLVLDFESEQFCTVLQSHPFTLIAVNYYVPAPFF